MDRDDRHEAPVRAPPGKRAAPGFWAQAPAQADPGPIAPGATLHGTRLARMQALLAIALAAATLIAASAAAVSGQLRWALAVLLAVPALHAALMAVEFAWTRSANRGDPVGAPGRRATLAAWWREWIHALRVFGLWQPFLSRSPGDHVPPDARGRRGVLLVHGFVCNRGLWRRWLPRLAARGIPCVTVDLEPAFGGIEDYADRIESGVRMLEAATGRSPVVVAHSMGGLAVRHWWASRPAARLHHLVTIGSPHRGTRLARFAHAPNARQMRERSEWTSALLARQPLAQHARTTCYFAHADNIVFPASGATLPGADNRHLGAVGHLWMVEHPEPFAALLERLEEPDVPDRAVTGANQGRRSIAPG
jgi:predicted alpha/beta hydrolase family esterase